MRVQPQVNPIDQHLQALYAADVLHRPAEDLGQRPTLLAHRQRSNDEYAAALGRMKGAMGPIMRTAVKNRLERLQAVLQRRPQDYVTKKMAKYLTEALG